MQEQTQAIRKCTLCPAGCGLQLARPGPQTWRSEYPLDESGCLCARGSSLAELLNHPRRIRTPQVRAGGRLGQRGFAEVVGDILKAAGDRPVTIFLDGGLPCQQLVAAAGWCGSWPNAELCLVIEPAEEQLLLGVEAAEARYLSDQRLSECDGFFIIGDAFSANPACARGVLERRKAESRTPVVVIDPGRGAASKFATHLLDVAPGMELSALLALSVSSGLDVPAGQTEAIPEELRASAAEAGRVLSNCRRLAVLIAADPGRTAAWRRIGYLAARLAGARGGGVAPQTNGANILAALRLGKALEALSLGEALRRDGVFIAVGCDLLGMLGRRDLEVLAAAAALPNATTEAAEFILPTALPCELAGTVLFGGEQLCEVAPLLPPPAGLASPAEVVAALARQAGATRAEVSFSQDMLQRVADPAPEPIGADADPAPRSLILARNPIHCGCGWPTRHGSWQAAIQELPEFRLSAAEASALGVRNLQTVSVTVGDCSAKAKVRLAPELSGRTLVLSDGFAEARKLIPCVLDPAGAALVTRPVVANVEPLNGTE